jgi:hypothetical protein
VSSDSVLIISCGVRIGIIGGRRCGRTALIQAVTAMMAARDRENATMTIGVGDSESSSRVLVCDDFSRIHANQLSAFDCLPDPIPYAKPDYAYEGKARRRAQRRFESKDRWPPTVKRKGGWRK